MIVQVIVQVNLQVVHAAGARAGADKVHKFREIQMC